MTPEEAARDGYNTRRAYAAEVEMNKARAAAQDFAQVLKLYATEIDGDVWARLVEKYPNWLKH